MFNGIVFSGVQFGGATMGMAEGEDPSDDPCVRPRNPVLEPAMIPLQVALPARGQVGLNRNYPDRRTKVDVCSEPKEDIA